MHASKSGSSLNFEDVCSHLGLMPAAVLKVSGAVSPYYTVFERPKRSGGVRTITASQGRLKNMQRALLDGVLSSFPLPDHVHGCVKGRSVATNAAVHVDREVVINIDLCKFFDCIGFEIVSTILMDKFNFDSRAASIFARLTLFSDMLPQGAPSSPVLANLAALPLDDAIMSLCRQVDNEFAYSRYVDDITISGAAALVELVPEIYKCIAAHSFKPNVPKTRILRRSMRQSVTGIVVNKKPSVPKTLIRNIRQQLYYCEKWGIKEHCESKGVRVERFLKTMRGSIAYVGVAKPRLAENLATQLTIATLELEQTSLERRLDEMKRTIDKGDVIEFWYDGERHRAAPAMLSVYEEDNLAVRAFQLLPEQGWKVYVLDWMEKMRVVK